MIYEGTGGPGDWEPDINCMTDACDEKNIGKCIYSFAGKRNDRVKWEDATCELKADSGCYVSGIEEENPCKPSYMTLKDMAIIYACGTVIMHIQTVLKVNLNDY